MNAAGVWTALITPMQADGRLDVDSLCRLALAQTAAGVRGLVLCGTTGEASTLERSERTALVRAVRAACGSETHLMVGCGASSTEEACQLAEDAVAASADSLLVVTPPYSKPNASGLLEHFGQLRRRVGEHLPLVLYHVPGRTGQHLGVAQLANLVRAVSAAAIKEASGSVAYFSELAAALPDVAVLSGDDPTFLPSLAVGGQGVISVVSLVAPMEVVALHAAFLRGDLVTAVALHRRLAPLAAALFWESNPVPVKAALAQLGILSSARVRSPLGPLAAETAQSLGRVVADFCAQRGVL